MKNKGFTLVELLATLTILALLVILAVPAVESTLKKNKEKMYQIHINEIKDAIKSWGDANVSSLPDEGETIYITLGDLKEEGLIIYKFKNPKTKNCYSNSNRFSIFNDEGRYVYNVDELLDGGVADCESPDIQLEDIILTYDADNSRTITKNDKVCIGEECFYVISNDGTKVRMLAEWNLNVGYDLSYNGSDIIPYDFNPGFLEYDSTYQTYIFTNLTYTKLNPSIVKQDSTKRGTVIDEANNQVKIKGVVSFAKDLTGDDYGYWAPSRSLLSKYGTSYPAYVYDENSNIYPYINSYVETLKSMTGNTNITGNLITYDELISLGCDANSYTCSEAPSYVYQTSYWSGAADFTYSVWYVNSVGNFDFDDFNYIFGFGVRPVITVKKSDIQIH